MVGSKNTHIVEKNLPTRLVRILNSFTNLRTQTNQFFWCQQHYYNVTSMFIVPIVSVLENAVLVLPFI
jgi:hypothetical protein